MSVAQDLKTGRLSTVFRKEKDQDIRIKDAVAPQSPFVPNAPEGQYALFFGSRVDRLEHVIHAEVYQPGKFRMFDPQNGQTVTLDDLMSLRIKWGGSADSPVVPYLIKGTE